MGALDGPATDHGDEEVRRRNRKEQGHQGARGLHEVGGGMPGVSRRVCTEAGLGSGCGVRRGRRIDGSVGRGRAEREADASTNQRRRGEAQIVPSGSGGIRGGHAASHPLRQQGGCVEARSEVRRGRTSSRRRASTCPPFGSGAGCSDSQRRGRAARSGYHPVGNGRRSGSGARGLVGRAPPLRESSFGHRASSLCEPTRMSSRTSEPRLR